MFEIYFVYYIGTKGENNNLLFPQLVINFDINNDRKIDIVTYL